MPPETSPDPDYRPDFYDRDGLVLRCRVCGVRTSFEADSGRAAEYLDTHVGEAIGCPACGLASRIPSLDEAEWPNRKHPDDVLDGVPMTERRQSMNPGSDHPSTDDEARAT